MNKKIYDRAKVLNYANTWALKRNPRFYNYDNIGGDCTNFASQCIFAGSGIMNYNKVKGWYYNSANDKSPSWTGVDFLYNFLVNNKSVGPHGKIVQIDEVDIGDLVQLSFDGNVFSHSLIIVKIKYPISINNTFVAAHTYDVFEKEIGKYSFKKIRFINIEDIYSW